MRRHDREITDSREILSIVNECKVIRLAMLDEQGLPYIIPLNFGYRFADGVFTFYCHSAREGRKLELLRRDPRVSFEMDCRGELQSADHACGYGYYYASVIGSGTKYDSRSTGELERSLGLTPPLVDRDGNHNIKVGFAEPRSDGGSNAMLANIIEYGKSGQPAKPFLKPAQTSSRKACTSAMIRKLEEEVEKL